MTTLREALERLSFAAQTTGGVAGPDPELMAAIEQAAQALADNPVDADRREKIARAWQDLLDKDDRTSPSEYPEMCLITFDELSAIIAELDQ